MEKHIYKIALIVVIILLLYFMFNDTIEAFGGNSEEDNDKEPVEYVNNPPPPDMSNIINKPSNSLADLQKEIDSNIESTISEEDILEYKKRRCNDANNDPNFILGYDPGVAYMMDRQNNYFNTSTILP